jgi:hypothetical protein
MNIQEIQEAIALLRMAEDEAFVIDISDRISIEIHPASHDDRVTVVHRAFGCTTVNYTYEGVIVDVYPEGSGELVHSIAIPAENLEYESPDEKPW